jgi:hypothetical protein
MSGHHPSHERHSKPLSWIGWLLLATGCLPGMILSSCYEEKFTTDTGDSLSFTIDTLTFDTVLTEISTVTRYFKVYNPHDLSIRISDIRLQGTNAAFFRLNVDVYMYLQKPPLIRTNPHRSALSSLKQKQLSP